MPSCLDASNPLDLSDCEINKPELALLDLYAGCGGMSTGLCLGAKLSGVKLVTVTIMILESYLKLLYSLPMY